LKIQFTKADGTSQTTSVDTLARHIIKELETINLGKQIEEVELLNLIYDAVEKLIGEKNDTIHRTNSNN
jgi:hypothetical protein